MVSTTVTNCVSDTEFPDESVAVHVTIVSPRGNVSGASLVIDDTSILSSAVEFSSVILLPSNPVASATIFSGVSILGDVVSTTVTNCVPDTELPALSEAVQVTIVSPRGNFSGASLVIDDTPTISEVSAIPRITKLSKGFSAS